jgi:hypothetical protein
MTAFRPNECEGAQRSPATVGLLSDVGKPHPELRLMRHAQRQCTASHVGNPISHIPYKPMHAGCPVYASASHVPTPVPRKPPGLSHAAADGCQARGMAYVVYTWDSHPPELCSVHCSALPVSTYCIHMHIKFNGCNSLTPDPVSASSCAVLLFSGTS